MIRSSAPCGPNSRAWPCSKPDLGLSGRDDAELVARIDDVVRFMLERYGRALLAGDASWLRRYAWFVEACGRHYREDAVATLYS